MKPDTLQKQGQARKGRSFLRLVLVMFVVILAAVLIATQLGDSQGTMDFHYDGFG